MRKKKEVNKPFDGGFDVKAMVEALSYYVNPLKKDTKILLIQTMLMTY